jgi:para-nitrobenzyl esterase
MLGIAMYSFPARRLAEFLTQNSDAEIFCNYARVDQGRHGGIIKYLNLPLDDLKIDYRKNRNYMAKLLSEFISTGKPYNETIKYEWPLYDEDRLVLELDPDDIKSVSVINRRYPTDLPWQSYKL